MRRSSVLAACLVAATSAVSSTQRPGATASLTDLVQASSVIVVADVQKIRTDVLAKNSSSPLEIQRTIVRVVEWIKSPADLVRPTTFDVAQCSDGSTCESPFLDSGRRYVLFLDRWAAAAAYALIRGSEGVWLIQPGSENALVEQVREALARGSPDSFSTSARAAIDRY